MKIPLVLFAQVLALAILPVAAYGQLGSQSFPAIDLSDDTVNAAEVEVINTELSRPGTLPDNPMYLIKRIGEAIRLVLTFDTDAKAKLHLEFANTRLAEAKKMIDENKTTHAKNAAEDYDREMDGFESTSNGIGRNVSAYARDSEKMLVKSSFVLGLVYDKVPDAAKPAIANAMNNSIEHISRIVSRAENTTDAELRKRVEKEYDKSVRIRRDIKNIVENRHDDDDDNDEHENETADSDDDDDETSSNTSSGSGSVAPVIVTSSGSTVSGSGGSSGGSFGSPASEGNAATTTTVESSGNDESPKTTTTSIRTTKRGDDNNNDNEDGDDDEDDD